ncbi:MAG: FAD-binding oxidoreductase [Myxococcales bacterium]|nr:FAD-binding oxidoreductase [Myxococcales bacterium]
MSTPLDADLAALAAVVGPDHISTRGADQTAYSRDLWPRAQLERLAGEAPTLPAAVVWPGTAEEAAALVRVCVAAGRPIVPFGAGSGVCGGARPMERGVVIDLKRLKALRRVDEAAGTIEVEAGYMGERLERQLERRGLTLGHFPSSILCSTVGGWLAGRSAGQCSSRYGKIEDMVVDLEVVAGDGVLRRTPAYGSLGQGLDWNQAFVGSEGTLGLITAATLRVHAQPARRCFRGWLMPDVDAGLKVMRGAMQAGLRPAVLRLYDPVDTVMVGSNPDAKHGGPLAKLKTLLNEGTGGLKQKALVTALSNPRWLNAAIDLLPQKSLLVTVTEGQDAEARAEDAAIAGLARAAGGQDLGEGPGRAWLAHRYDVSYKQSKLYAAGAFVDTFEVAGTWTGLGALYDAVRRAVGDKVLVMAHFSHAYPGGGSIYFTFAGAAASRAAQLARYDAAWRAGLDTVVEHGATIAHHHGSGLSRRSHMDAEHGAGRAWFDALKQVLDPTGIFNPGKLFVPR